MFAIDSEEPLPYAVIQIEGSHLGAVADSLGRFRIDGICSNEVHLSIRYVGYKTVVHHHDFYHSEPTIYLAPEEIALESVVIEKDRSENVLHSLPVSIKRVEVLEALSSSSIGDLLSTMTGVSLLKTGQNVVKPVVHGLHSNRVLILNNGVRHAYQAWGREHAPEISPSQMDRLTLVKGAATVQYGPEALGGVILLHARIPKYDQPLLSELSTNYETNGRAVSSQLFLSQGFHRAAWNASINGTIQGDLQAPDYVLSNTGKRETGYHLSTRFHFPTVDLDLFAGHFEQTLGILRSSITGNIEDLSHAITSTSPSSTQPFSYNINNPKQETIHDLFKVKSSLYPGGHQIDIQYALQRNLRKEFDVRRGEINKRPAINLALFTHSLDLAWHYPATSSMKGLLGWQVFYQDNNNMAGTSTIPFVPNYNVINMGLFTVQKWTQNASTYEVGFRYDYQYINVRGRAETNDLYKNEIDYNNITFNLGFEKRLSGGWLVGSNVASAWRPPKTGELYSFGKHQFTLEYGLWRYQLFPENDSISTRKILNDDIKEVKSERGLKWIGNVEIQKTMWSAEIVPYLNLIQNYFFVRPYGITNTVRGAFPYFIHDQTDALFYGLDLDVSIQYSPTLSSEVKFAYVHAQDMLNNQYFLEIPPLNVSFNLAKKISRMEIALSGEWTSKQGNAPPVIDPTHFLDDSAIINQTGTFDFIPATSGYFLLHLRANYVKKPFKATLRIENVFNESYRVYTDRLRYFADDAGINLSLGLSYCLSK